MSSAHDMPLPVPGAGEPHHLRTIREIRGSLPADQIPHFDAELAETDIDDLPAMLAQWASVGNDGFLDFLLSAPFEGMDLGARSYGDTAVNE